MSDSPFPKLFDADRIDRSIPYDPTVDTVLVNPPVVDPDERHPLERRYPRIVDRLVGLWGSPVCGEYLQSLILMDRGDLRQGFPPELIEDLMLLDYCHHYRPGLFPPRSYPGAPRR